MPSGITEVSNRFVYRAGSNAPITALHRIRGETPDLEFTATAPASSISWSDNGAGGQFSASGGSNEVATYIPLNKTQQIVISATDSGGTANRNLTVNATMPLNPQVGGEIELDVETKIKYARDRTRYFREEGYPEIAYVWAWENRQTDGWAELLRFWRDHRKVIPFYLVDVEGNLINNCWFNSSFKSAFNGKNRWAMTASFVGVFQDVAYV